MFNDFWPFHRITDPFYDLFYKNYIFIAEILEFARELGVPVLPNSQCSGLFQKCDQSSSSHFICDPILSRVVNCT